ncbi:MAG: TlpA disulfide reductase family protein [Mucinivorans sp.]
MNKNKFNLITLLTLVMATTSMAQNTVILGKAPQGCTTVDVMCQKSMTESLAQSEVKDGTFEIKINIDVPTLLSLSYEGNNAYIPIYVVPNSKLSVDLTSVSGAQFSGIGASESAFMGKAEKQLTEMRKTSTVPITESVAYRDMLLEQTKQISNFVDNAKLDNNDFAETLKLDYTLKNLRAIINYTNTYKLLTQGKTADLAADFYAPLLEAPLSNPHLENLTYTQWFLSDYFELMETEGLLATDMPGYIALRVDKIGVDKVKELYALHALSKELYFYNQYFLQISATVEDVITSRKGKAKLDEYETAFAQKAVDNQQFNYGQPMIKFKGMDREDKQHSLEDYAGKIVVVDIWDTGCAPCIAQIPYLQALEKELQDKPVAFISYSLDSKKEKWTDFMDKKGMHGIQLINQEGPKCELVRFLKMRGVPRFVVINKNGKIVETNAPRPSDPKLKLLIERELAK